MARPLRIEYPGAYYHVINRGKNIKILRCDPLLSLNLLVDEPDPLVLK